jgi:putative cell wall-binding protein
LLTDSRHQLRKSPTPRGKGPAATKDWYSDRQKIEAVQTYLLIGNLAEVARQLQINEHTLRTWKTSEWWSELTQEIQKQETIVLNKKLKSIADKSLELMADRLEKGDYIYDQKTGQIKRKPVNLRDATQATTAVLSIQDKLQSKENFTVAQEHIEQKLSKLAEAFTKLSKGEKLEEAEDIEYVERTEENQNSLST